MTKVVVFGASGMVGTRVCELLKKNFQFVRPSEEAVDITNKKQLETYLGTEKPQIVVNFAAITDVDFCETERENKDGVVWKVNALAPGYLALLSKSLDFYFVQISTDMVFPGSREDSGPYAENHPHTKPDKLTWYGASKAEGEKAVLVSNKTNAIVRIIYPICREYPQKLDYARKILKLYDEGRLYPMFADQQVNITYIDELSMALKTIFTKKLSGVFHVSSSDLTTPYDFASYLIRKARKATKVVKSSNFEDFIKNKDPRRYPQFGGLKNELTQKKLGRKFSTWKEIVNSLTSSLQ